MKQSKLYIGLCSLSKSESKSLRKYVTMETSENSDANQLLSFLIDSQKKPNHEILKNEIKQSLFPKMIEKSFLNLCSRLFILFEEWIVWYTMKNEKDKSDVLLVKIYNRRGVYSLANKKFNSISKKLENQSLLSLEQKSLLTNLYHHHYFSNNPLKHQLKKELLEKTVANSLISHKERANIYTSELLNWGKIINYAYTDLLHILQDINTAAPDSSVSQWTEQILSIYRDKNTEALEKTIHELQSGIIKPASDLHILSTLYCINACILFWNSGDFKKKKLIFDIYNYAFDSGVFEKMGQITPTFFYSTVSVLALMTDPPTLYKFVDEWVGKVKGLNIESTRALAYSYIKRKEGKYSDIILLLRGKHFNKIYYEYMAYSFETMALYKEKEYEILANRIHNHKRSLRNMKKKISASSYKGYFNFFSALEKMMKQGHKENPIDLTIYKDLFHRIWLREQVKGEHT